ncbi:hypothetical protein PG999_001405 [Apiospora kogelbergensis]|uniref:Uncharacterized protein n=1 Tax=Apiospora kogelbergensis TaxID=1337665 RepID=A0AAW0RE72_9PEZI
MVYKAVMDEEDTIPMVRSLAYSQAQQRFYILSNHAPYLRPPGWGLLATIPEAFGEALRMGRVQLPARHVTFPGASVAHPDIGLVEHPLVSEAVDNDDGGGGGGGLYNPAATVFYLDHASLMALFRDAAAMTTPPPADRFAWLTDLLLDRRTFEHLLWVPRPSRRPTAQPFASLPGLRRLVVGFLHRWQDVAVLEGPYGDVVEELDVDVYYSANPRSTAADPDDNGEGRSTDVDDEPTVSYVAVRPRRVVHPMITHIITETVLHTASSVRALNRAGVRVTWAVIRQGVTRRRDVMLGTREVRRP